MSAPARVLIPRILTWSGVISSFRAWAHRTFTIIDTTPDPRNALEELCFRRVTRLRAGYDAVSIVPTEKDASEILTTYKAARVLRASSDALLIGESLPAGQV